MGEISARFSGFSRINSNIGGELGDTSAYSMPSFTGTFTGSRPSRNSGRHAAAAGRFQIQRPSFRSVPNIGADPVRFNYLCRVFKSPAAIVVNFACY